MHNLARIDLTMLPEEKDLFSRAAALLGTTMSAFVRTAAKEKADELIDKDSRLILSNQDFQTAIQALNKPFAPHATLQKAFDAAQQVKRA
jgi:uncharacterized protein (DUF1778 family)